jgi:hypothetical protein
LNDATIALADPVTSVPRTFPRTGAERTFRSHAGPLDLDHARRLWRGSAPDLTMKRLSGGIDNGPAAIVFDNLAVETPRSQFTLTGRIDREKKDERPTTLDLKVHATRFPFQEWAGVLNGLRNIAVEANFDTTLRGPLTRLATDLRMQSTVAVRGTLVLDTKVPGWPGEGTVTTSRIDLRADEQAGQTSDISGRVTFNLAFGSGQHFPRATALRAPRHAIGARATMRARGGSPPTGALAEATATAWRGRPAGAGLDRDQGTLPLSLPGHDRQP